MSTYSTRVNLSAMKDKWPSTIIAREKVSDFTGGLLTRGTIANLDSKGEGPPRFSMGPKKICYPVDSFIAWLERRIERLSTVEPRSPRKAQS
jgi:hypothetical protein